MNEELLRAQDVLPLPPPRAREHGLGRGRPPFKGLRVEKTMRSLSSLYLSPFLAPSVRPSFPPFQIH